MWQPNRYFNILLLFSIFIVSASAQFGVRIKYNNNNFSDWENGIKNRFNINKKLLSPGYETGIDYWFRLKKRRIEFLPEISYSQATTTYDLPSIDQMKYTSFNFNFHTQVYALDLEGDCDCPTFSKQGPSFNKGLFFHFTPGVSIYKGILTPNELTNFEETNTNGVAFKAGVGIGMDVGISDFLTITPLISYNFHTVMNWKNLDLINIDNTLTSVDSKNNLSQLQFTLRVGFRPDYGRRGRRR